MLNQIHLLKIVPTVCLLMFTGARLEVGKGLFKPLSVSKGKRELQPHTWHQSVTGLCGRCRAELSRSPWSVAPGCEPLPMSLAPDHYPAHLVPEPARGITAWTFGPSMGDVRESLHMGVLVREKRSSFTVGSLATSIFLLWLSHAQASAWLFVSSS